MQIIKIDVRPNIQTFMSDLHVHLCMPLNSTLESLNTETGRTQLETDFINQLTSAINGAKAKI